MNSQTHPPRSIQTWADWEAALESNSCTEAEIALVAACREGRQCELGDGTRPDTPTPQNQIGADLLRYLIKGGCDECDLHDWGVDLVGAYITGALDLRLVKATGVTGLINCHFDSSINAMNAKFDFLNLSGSSCLGLFAQGVEVKGSVFIKAGFAAKGAVSLASAVIRGQLNCDGGCFENAEGDALDAQGAEVKGDVFLRNGFVAKGEVSLAGAVIGGQFSCSGGCFESPKRQALYAQSVEVKGDVFLRKGFTAKGAVSLAGAVIGGQFACTGGRFENAGGDALAAEDLEVKGGVFLRDGFAAKGTVSLSSAVIGGQLDCDGGSFENAGGRALNAQNVEVNSLIWRNVETCLGSINLAGARLQNLTDAADSWDKVDEIFLDGLSYQTIHGPLDTEMRLNWLGNACTHDGSFSPQPYEQLAWTLKRMGQSEQRRVILIEKEKRQRSYARGSLRFKRRLSRLMSRLSVKQDKPSLQAVEMQVKELGAANIEFNNQLTDRFLIFHGSWPQWAQSKGVPAVEIARAQAGFREQIFWANGRIRARIAWMHLKDWAAWLSVGYGYRPFNSVWFLTALIAIGWGVAAVSQQLV